MALGIGIVGLPNVGKSTLFNALSGSAQAQAANYPFCTIDPNLGVVPVPDERLARLAALFKPKKTTPTTLEFVDIAGLVAGASKGEGLGNQFLSHIRQVDAIAHVLRCFDDPDVVHVVGKVDPRSDRDVVETELMLKDLESVEKRRERTAKNAKGVGKPGELAKAEGFEAVPLCGKVEAEIAELPAAERTEFLQGLGLSEPGLNRLVHAGYRELGLITFLTAGEDECRAWTVHRGARAPQAAGVIHTDFERGFIKAEVMRVDDLLRLGSEAAVKEMGLMRVEGKEDVVQDGDVMQ